MFPENNFKWKTLTDTKNSFRIKHWILNKQKFLTINCIKCFTMVSVWITSCRKISYFIVVGVVVYPIVTHDISSISGQYCLYRAFQCTTWIVKTACRAKSQSTTIEYLLIIMLQCIDHNILITFLILFNLVSKLLGHDLNVKISLHWP